MIEELIQFRCVHLMGLMTIAPLTQDTEIARKCFRDLRLLNDQVHKQFSNDPIEMKYLSMGMTDDYEIALEEGSNMVRIGRAIFQS